MIDIHLQLSKLKNIVSSSIKLCLTKPDRGEAYIGYLGRGNFGDELLFEIYSKVSDKKVIPILDVLFFYKNFTHDLVLGGGTIIGGDIYLSAMKAFARKPKKVFCSGVIPGIIDSEWKNFLNESLVYTRSEKSKQMLLDFGLKCESRVDPAIYTSKVFAAKHGNVNREYTLIAPHYSGAHLDQIEFFILKRKPLAKSIIWFSSSYTDIKLCKVLARKYGGRVLYGWKNIPKSLEYISSSKFVLSVRLHPSVCAASYKVPFVLLPYDQKHTEFLHSVGLENNLCRKTEDLEEKLIEHYDSNEILFSGKLENQLNGYSEMLRIFR